MACSAVLQLQRCCYIVQAQNRSTQRAVAGARWRCRNDDHRPSHSATVGSVRELNHSQSIKQRSNV